VSTYTFTEHSIKSDSKILKEWSTSKRMLTNFPREKKRQSRKRKYECNRQVFKRKKRSNKNADKRYSSRLAKNSEKNHDNNKMRLARKRKETR
jgi:hypothetical protein